MMETLPLFQPEPIPERMRYRGGVSTHDAGHSQLVYRFANDWAAKGHTENLSPGTNGCLIQPNEFGIVFQKRLDGHLVPFDLVVRSSVAKLFVKVCASGRGRSQTSMFRLPLYMMQASVSPLFKDSIYLVLIGDHTSNLSHKFPEAEKDLQKRNRLARKQGGCEVFMMTYGEFKSEFAIANRLAENKVLP